MNQCYAVAEVFTSLQGEGGRAGRATRFIRLSGCNLACAWCDTDHRVSSEMNIEELVGRMSGCSVVCITGGEPLVQPVGALIAGLHSSHKLVQIETNGSLLIECRGQWAAVDILTVSPKYRERPGDVGLAVGAVKSRAVRDTEFKFVVGEDRADGLDEAIDQVRAAWMPVYLQPESNRQEAVRRCVEVVQKRASEQVRLSLQIHKLLGLR